MTDSSATLPPPAGSLAMPHPGACTEAFDAEGRPRPAWQGLLRSIGLLGAGGFAERVEDGRRIVREHGVSVPLPGDPEAMDRPWEMDFLPFVIDAEEWRGLEAGLIQRAHLLNAILQDLHGQQRLVRDGFIPGPLVFANPHYLRACQAIKVPDGTYLHTYAVDLARSPDGRWWVLADRTQSPTGLGFAQESRTVTSRVLPECIRDVHPRPLAATLRIRRENLRRLAAAHPDGPSIVLLTPGPRNEAWFEHVYLARLLGFTLVEGGDLTVRDRRVYIKTLDGLRRVDVILRRVSDAFCDPLELRGDSLLGVPGLVEATRAGHVAIANALGSALLEGPAFLPFLPTLSRRLLGEDLKLPSVPTWWCGQARELDYASEHAAELLFRAAFTLLGDPAPAEPGRLLNAMRLRPHEYVGQQAIRLSRAPILVEDRWGSLPFVLRAFVVRDGDGYAVLPGGLARLLPQEHAASFSLSLAGPCKDVWVLPGEETASETSWTTLSAPPQHDRTPSDLPSRTADNFFWLGRYTERLEDLARVMRCVLGRLADDADPMGERQMGALAQFLVRLGLLPAGPASVTGRESLQKEMLLMLHKEERFPGVRDLLKRIHVAAFAVRYRLSADTWRILNRLEPDARQRPARLPLVAATTVLNTLVLDLAAFSGMEMENMTRGHGWVFLDLGRRIERGLSGTHLLAALRESGMDRALLYEPALEVADSVMTHRRRFVDQPRWESVLEILGQEPTNPRAVRFQVERMAELAASLPGGLNPEGAARIRQRSEALVRTMRMDPPEEEARDDAAWLAQVEAGLVELSELITQVYFSQVPLRVN